jgi:hypothetical protein
MSLAPTLRTRYLREYGSMTSAIVVLLVVGFALCVAVGLLTVLQNLLSDDSVEDSLPEPLCQDRSAE